MATFLPGEKLQKDTWKEILESNTPWKVDFPKPYKFMLSEFQKLLLYQVIREEKLLTFVQNYITETMGQHFIESPPFDLLKAFEDSSLSTPIIFVLSAGADPMRYLLDLAKD